MPKIINFAILLTVAALIATPAKAGIVITAVSSVVDNAGDANKSDVTLTINGRSDVNGIPPGEGISTWGFSLTTNSVSNLVLDPTHAVGTFSSSNFDRAGTGLAGAKATFKGFLPVGPIYGAGDSNQIGIVDSLIGVLKFTVDKGAVPTDVAAFLAFAEEVAPGVGTGTADAAGSPGVGFWRDDRGAFGSGNFIKSPTTFGTSGDLIPAALSAVPEPSSVLLCGMGLLGLVGYRRRRMA